MRILLVHNQYRGTSGEDAMVARVAALLTEFGHTVSYYTQSSEDIVSFHGKVDAFLSGYWSDMSRRSLLSHADAFAPDIIQIQNLYPLISPSVLPAIRSLGVPIVMRLANYRLACPIGTYFSQGQVCRRCLGGKEYWCIARNCGGSFAKSAAYATRNGFARIMRFFADNVDRYYAQTAFQRDQHTRMGIAEDQIDVIPNFVPPPRITAPSRSMGEYVAFAGRLSAEKGVNVLLEAAAQCPAVPFRIAGSGELSEASVPSNVSIVGSLNGPQLDAFYQRARFVVVPSLWFEGFPNVALEAMRFGKPVLASNLGGLPEVVREGLTGQLFPPGAPNALAELVVALWNDDGRIREYGHAALERVVTEHSPSKYHERLMDFYRRACPPLGNQECA